MADTADHEALVMQLVEFIPGSTPEQALQYLSANDWDLDAAAASLMADAEEAEDDADAAPTAAGPSLSSAAPADYTGPRTLDGRPAPASPASTAKKSQPKKKGLATLSSLGGGGHGHDDDDDDDSDDDEPHGPRDTYAGGEKSGLAVQDPNQRSNPQRILDDLLAKARSQAPRPEASSEAGPSAPTSFRGSGQTLGGEGVESRTIPDPSGPAAAPATSTAPASNAPVQERTLHLWRDGFSIDDGPLRRFDDPANAAALRQIQQGRAPIQLMNVKYDEPLDVKLQQHDENFRQLPKVYKPFGGEGRRLGSPVPGASEAAVSSTLASTTAPTTAASSSAASGSASQTPASTADTSQPTIMIRIQMPDGARLPARFNTTQSVGDIYDFITQASPDLRSGGWVLATTFPNKDHTDKSLILGEMSEFKKGGTAMVKRST